MNLPFRNKTHSLSLGARIIWVFILVTLLTIFIFISSFKHLTSNNERKLPKVVADYTKNLVIEIGEPATIENAQVVAKRTGMDIYIKKGSKIIGTTAQKLNNELANSDDFLEIKLNALIFQMRFKRGQAIVTVIKPNESIIFVTSFKHSHSGLIFISFIFSLILVIYLAYRVVHYLISPIQDIEIGVEKFSKGDLSYRIDRKRNDDLGELTKHINQMAEQLEGIIEAKHQLLIAISHELRTPMTRMKIVLDLPYNEKNKYRLNDSLQQMEQLLSEILETKKLNDNHNKPVFSKVSLNELVNNLIELEYPNNSQIKRQLTDAITDVNVDVMRLRLVIRNLIGNAIKYGLGKSITVSTKTKADKVILEVIDQGEGIEENNLNKVFDAFYREDQARQRQTGGTGMGLYLVKLIVKAHNGQIQIKSKKNKGTKVILKLNK